MGMNPKLRSELISAGVTFLAAFLIAVGGELSISGDASFTVNAIFAIVMTGVRAGVKALSTLVVKY
jgi:hypothetical protein